MSSSAGAQMLANPSVGVSSMSTPVLPQRTPPQFYYLDPTKQERGPFEKIQMDSWYKRGYFTEGLEVRRSTDTKYRTLGELMQLNGRITPFDYKDEVVPTPPVTAVFSNPSQSYPALFPYAKTLAVGCILSIYISEAEVCGENWGHLQA
ncbi:unnamed protein product [Cylicostephanus goldi]|uniref:GYF domain-containing protein n=1 Tax=Cylicostephanus goldi TaxID=71465 RepID=A0A3P7P0V7_CYLGO|nr:unnamed protein product [Cylicostephanus goldi]